MKSLFNTALIIAGITLFGLLFVACGSDAAEEPLQPVPARPAAPAAQAALTTESAPVPEAPSMVQQQPAPAQPARAPEASMPDAAPASAMASRPAPAPAPAPAAAPAPSADAMAMSEATSRPSGAASLTAGEVDDNQQWDEYLQYRQTYEGGAIHEVDVTERYTITVVDANDRPVPNAIVRVSADNPIFEGRTYASGQTLFFPRAFPRTEGIDNFRLYVAKDDVSQQLNVVRGQENEWVVRLNIDGSHRSEIPVDVLFLLDSTGSMSDEIDRIKESLLSISARISDLASKPNLRFGMVAYRDRGDDYITRVFDFDHDVHRFADTIREVHADGGGDEPESLNEALHVAVQKPNWRLGNAIRLVFLVADAPPHMDYPEDYNYAEEMVEAHRRGIKVFSIATSGLNDAGEYIFRQVAQHTMGRFIFILYGGGTPHQVSEYTVENLDDLVVRLVEEELAFLVQ